jgi:hypothetical protein
MADPGKILNLDLAQISQMNQMGIRFGGGDGEWFGPLLPPPDMAPPDVKGRLWDFPAGTNLAYIPRGDQPISFADLRGLAQHCDLVRMAIETRKDQMGKLNWTVKPVKGQEKNAAALAQAEAAKKLLKRPDRIHPFKQWLRLLLDEQLIIDAASIYLRRNKGGGLYALEIPDGATIRPVIDNLGRSPQPPDPAYVQVLKGVVASHLTREELIYLPRNPLTWRIYGYSPVEQVIITCNIILRRQLHWLQYYTDGNLPDALLEVPENWTTSQIAEWQQYWDSLFAGNTAMRRRGTWVPKGMTPHVMKEVDLKTPMEEWFARVVCYAFSLSPQPFVQIINRATAETAQQAALSEGLLPLMEWAADGVNTCLEVGGDGAFDLVEFAWEEESAVDPQEQATIDDLDVRNGIRTRKQIRADRGLEDDGLPDFIIIPGTGAVLLSQIGQEPEGVSSEPGAVSSKGQEENPEKGGGPDTPGPSKAKEPAPASTADSAAQKLAKAAAAEGKKKVKIEPIERQRPAMQQARAAIKKLFQEAFKADRPKVTEQLARGLKLSKAAEDERVDKLLAELDLAGIAATREEAAAILAKAAQNGGTAAFVQIDFDDPDITSQVNALAVEWAENRAADLVTKIEESTRDYLRADVTQAVQEGWSTAKLSDTLEANFGFSEARCDMIARTEIATADVQGNLTAYKASGLVAGKEWILGSEHPQDDECNTNAEQGAIPLEQDFSSGDDAPPAHPNCECDVLPVLEGE